MVSTQTTQCFFFLGGFSPKTSKNGADNFLKARWAAEDEKLKQMLEEQETCSSDI